MRATPGSFFDRKPAPETPWTRELWISDLGTNQHFTPKQNPPGREHLDEFVGSYKPGARGGREESERFQRFAYEELMQALEHQGVAEAATWRERTLRPWID